MTASFYAMPNQYEGAILKRLYLSPPHMSGLEQELVTQTFASNWIAPIGPMVDAFEAGLSAVTGAQYCVALSSGTAALHLALRLCDVRPGEEVWCPTMTFIGGVSPIIYEGAKPLFFDVDASTLLIDLDLLEETLAQRSRAGMLPKVVITTDLYGGPVDPVRLSGLAKTYGFRWISDSAESLGSTFGSAPAGAGSYFSILSFNGNKIITTSGGGALCTNDGAMADRARFLSTQAREPAPHYQHAVIGYNYRLSNVCAAIGVGQLSVLADRVTARRDINAKYGERLGNRAGIRLHAEPAGSRSNRWLTTLEIDPEIAACTVNDVRHALDALDIESRPLWKPMHLQPVFSEAKSVGGAVAERAFDRGLCLPSGSSTTDDDIDRVSEVILDVTKC